MILRVPDTLAIDNAEKYEVSIRLWPDGLSFAGHIPSEKESFFYTETKFDRAKSYVQVLKDVFFEHVFFSYPYKKTYVVCVNGQYTLVPATVFAEEHKEQLMSFVFSAPASKILHEPVEALDAEMLFGISREIYEFCSRSLIHPRFIHAITPLLLHWRKQNLACYPKQLYVVLHENIMDAACYDKGSLLFLNSFGVENMADILYYILYIWKQTGINQLEDQLLLSATPPVYRQLKEILQKYVQHIEPVKHPSRPASMGNEEVPLDILSLFGCES
ncbi:MAG: DUF3822 family protein [Tannerella sp.]|jgi:hypothetical protein|nr:DUF3822 family protein [Tannerella sp.]